MYENLCRMCTKSSEKGNCSIFDSMEIDTKSTSICNLIEMLTAKEVNKDDTYPKNICSTCYSALLDVYKLKLKCIATLEYFCSIRKKENDFAVKEDWLDLEENDIQFEFNVPNISYDNSIQIKEDIVIEDDTIKAASSKILKSEKEKSSDKKGKKRKRIRLKKFECKLCDRKFAYTAALVEHYKSHREKYYCDICKKYYKSEKLHKSVKHKEMPTTGFACDTCGKLCRYKSVLISHLNTHSKSTIKEFKLKCNFEGCNKKFPTKTTLERHSAVHSDSKDFLCEICSKCFKDKYLLSIHMMSHDKERSYPCRFCDKILKAKSSRIYHERKHKHPERYTCNICEGSYCSQSKLKRHILSHGEKKLQCRYCEKKFHRRDLLKSHEHRMHNMSLATKSQDLTMLQSTTMF